MLDTTSPENIFSKHSLGKLYGVNLFVLLHEKDVKTHIKLKFLPKQIKDEIQEIRAQSQKITLGTFIDNNTDPEYELSHNEYYEQIAFQDSAVFHRSIDTNTFLKYLFQSLTTDQLKDIFREHDIKGYSKFNKSDLIGYLLLNLSEEEKIDWLRLNELKIINEELQKAVDILFHHSKETLSEIKVTNKTRNEIEARFKGPQWEITNFLSITKDNIADPDRDCDCRTGSQKGFCPHFWIAFLKAFQLGYFQLQEWKVTQLPYQFMQSIETFTKAL
ncbi:MAG: hypothetical protein EU548_06895 [Promethearchaeota archaeon]|nr:MAG: hypothetical protein EU548_06895 [Candidatus Lokiarchaeota archaeon]